MNCHTSKKISENFNIYNKAKQIYPKKQKKKASKKRYSMSFRSSHSKVLCKKGVLKNFTTRLFAYFKRHQVVDKNLSLCQNLKFRKTALSSIFYFEKVLLFWRSINKNVLEWFLPITSKEYTLFIYTLTRSSNLLCRNHPMLRFWCY